MDTNNRRLMWHGMFLFLRVVTGFAEGSVSPTCAWDSPRT